jgi:hypothetical protein
MNHRDALTVAITLLAASVSIPANAQNTPQMKMTTDIPQSITTPNSVETRLGMLKFFDVLLTQSGHGDCTAKCLLMIQSAS